MSPAEVIIKKSSISPLDTVLFKQQLTADIASSWDEKFQQIIKIKKKTMFKNRFCLKELYFVLVKKIISVIENKLLIV